MYIKCSMSQSNSLVDVEYGGKKYHRILVGKNDAWGKLWGRDFPSQPRTHMKDEFVKWCDENLNGDWTYSWHIPNHEGDGPEDQQLMIFFEYESDMLAFKLRWS